MKNIAIALPKLPVSMGYRDYSLLALQEDVLLSAGGEYATS